MAQKKNLSSKSSQKPNNRELLDERKTSSPLCMPNNGRTLEFSYNVHNLICCEFQSAVLPGEHRMHSAVGKLRSTKPRWVIQ